jgi:hypothetical protein
MRSSWDPITYQHDHSLQFCVGALFHHPWQPSRLRGEAHCAPAAVDAVGNVASTLMLPMGSELDPLYPILVYPTVCIPDRLMSHKPMCPLRRYNHERTVQREKYVWKTHIGVLAMVGGDEGLAKTMEDVRGRDFGHLRGLDVQNFSRC